MDEIKQELKQENANVKANAVAKLVYVSTVRQQITSQHVKSNRKVCHKTKLRGITVAVCMMRCLLSIYYNNLNILICNFSLFKIPVPLDN